MTEVINPLYVIVIMYFEENSLRLREIIEQIILGNDSNFCELKDKLLKIDYLELSRFYINKDNPNYNLAICIMKPDLAKMPKSIIDRAFVDFYYNGIPKFHYLLDDHFGTKEFRSIKSLYI